MKSGWMCALTGLMLMTGCEGQIVDPEQPATNPGAVTTEGNPTTPAVSGAKPTDITGTEVVPVAPGTNPTTGEVMPPTTTTPPDPETVTPPAPPTMPPAMPPAMPPVTPPPAPPATGTIVPLYSFPTNAAWTAIVNAKMAHPSVPVIAVVNPSNGPGTTLSQPYKVGIERLHAAGIKVIGYVGTDYTRVPEATAKADIDLWKAFYPQVSGIFFDEQANVPGQEDYYRRLTAHARSKGLSYTVGNPGADVSPTYVGTVDTVLIYENLGVSTTAALAGWHVNHHPNNFGIIPYGTALDLAYVRAAKKHVGYIYLTNDTMPNPWDTLTPYFTDLLAALSAS